MPEYDFRCDACAHRFTRRFKTYALYDAASLLCPACESAELTRLISQVAVSKGSRDYRNMSSREMLSVLESGDSGQVDDMFKQVGGGEDRGAAASPASVDPAEGA